MPSYSIGSGYELRTIAGIIALKSTRPQLLPVIISSNQENLPEPELQLAPTFVFGLTSLVLVAMLISINAFWVNHPMLQYPDQSMYLAMAGLLLDGQKLYVDMVDFNPPLITYISLIPAIMSRLFYMPICLAFAYFVMGLIILSLLVSGVLLFQQRHRKESYFYPALLIGFLMLSQYLFTDFGQREHLLLITYFPFFILRYFRWQNASLNKYLAVFCGLYAATCLSLKPHFLFMAAAPELVYFLEKRKWRPLFAPEVFAVAALGLAYGVHFFFLDPDVSNQFFNFIVPLVRNGYDYYTVSFLKTIADFGREDTYLFVATIALSLIMRRTCPFFAPVAAFTLSAFVIYLLAEQDWSHHWLPVVFGVKVLIGLQICVAIRFIAARSGQASLINLYMFSILAAVGVLVYTAKVLQDSIPDRRYTKYISMKPFGYEGNCPLDDVGPWGEPVAKYSKIHDPILFLSDAIAPGYPCTLETNRRPASRYLHAMPLMMAKFLAYEKNETKGQLIFNNFYERILQEYAEDIKKNKPVLIVIRNSGIMEPLNRSNFIERYLNNYEKVETIDDHFIYRLKK